MVHVAARRLSGEVLELSVEDGRAVPDVKEAIRRAWGVPPICLTLLHGDAVLSDTSPLAACDGEPLHLTALVSLQQVRAELQSGVSWRQTAAVEALGELGLQGGSRSIDVLSACLEDPDYEVRLAAMKALPRVARSGEERVVAAFVTSLLEHSQTFVRCSEIEALSKLASRGDDRVVATMRGFLETADVYVRCAAVRALARVANIGDEGVVATARGLLKSPDARVRQAAADALSEVAGSPCPRGRSRSPVGQACC